VLNQLYRYSSLQTSFGVNMLALNQGKPEQMGLRKILEIFLSFREQVVTRRTKFRLAKARKRGHETVGLAIAVANIDEVIKLIRESPDPGVARERLIARDWPAGDMMPLIALIADPRTIVSDGDKIRLSDEQARAILALTLSRLTGLGRDDIAKAANEIAEEIAELLSILGSRERILDIIRGELIGRENAFGVPRRTQFSEADGDIDDEALIPREEMVVTVTHGGYVKRTPLAAYRTQRRGGKGRAGMQMKDEDFVTRVFVASTHAPILFFSSSGMAYKMKAWRIPAGDPRTKGRALVNLLPLGQGETITSVMALPEDERDWDKLDVMFATKSGNVRRNKLSDFTQVNRNGKIAMKPDEGDGIIGVQICSEDDDVLLTTSNGQCMRFRTTEVRVFKGRTQPACAASIWPTAIASSAWRVLKHVEVTPAEVPTISNGMRNRAAMLRSSRKPAPDV
jgi:DNA gyrase subunit A